jgi:hypothetical protein
VHAFSQTHLKKKIIEDAGLPKSKPEDRPQISSQFMIGEIPNVR